MAMTLNMFILYCTALWLLTASYLCGPHSRWPLIHCCCCHSLFQRPITTRYSIAAIAPPSLESVVAAFIDTVSAPFLSESYHAMFDFQFTATPIQISSTFVDFFFGLLKFVQTVFDVA